MREYVIREYEAGDEKGINDLFNEIFHEKRSLAEWSWKLRENPLGRTNLVVVAESQGRIVGQYANLPCLFKYQNKELLSASPVDNFVHPEFRGGVKGVQKEMFDLDRVMTNKNNIAFKFGFPNKEAYVVGKRILKYNDLGQISSLFKRLNWGLAVRNKFPRVPSPLMKFVQYVSRQGYRLSIQLKAGDNFKDIRIRSADSFDEKFDLFWDKVKDRYGIMAVRDRKYLAWRFARPGCDYQVYIAEKDGEVYGYIVTGIKRNEGMTVGYIMDLLTIDTPGIDAALITHALHGLISKKVDFVKCWMISDKEAYATLQKFGFCEREDHPPVNAVYFVYNHLEVDETFVKDPKNWYLTMSDSDVF